MTPEGTAVQLAMQYILEIGAEMERTGEPFPTVARRIIHESFPVLAPDVPDEQPTNVDALALYDKESWDMDQRLGDE